MIFFTRKKKLVVDCFTNNPTAYDLFKPDHASKFIPDWWKEIPVALPNKENPTDLTSPTIRGCTGIIEYYRIGIMIPFWSQVIIELGGIGSTYVRVAIADPLSDAKQHPDEQRGTFLPETKYSHIKFESPWMIQASDSVQFTMVKPAWNYSSPFDFILPPGTINFRYQHATNANVFFQRDKNTKIITMDPGTPIIHLMPNSDCRIELRHHLLTTEELSHKFYPKFRFNYTNAYQKYVKLKTKLRD